MFRGYSFTVTEKFKTAPSQISDNDNTFFICHFREFWKECKIRKRSKINATIITAYDTSLEEIIDIQLDLDSALAKSMADILSNLETSGFFIAGNFYIVREQYLNNSALVTKTLKEKIQETSKHPLYKYIFGQPKEQKPLN